MTDDERWKHEQELKKLYGLTDTEASLVIANKEMKRDAMSEYFNMNKATIRNILHAANKKMRKDDVTLSIIKPAQKDTRDIADIFIRFYSEVTDATIHYGEHTILITDNTCGVGNYDVIERNVFVDEPISSERLCRQYDGLTKELQVMGWGVLKKKLDDMYVKVDVF